MASEDRQRRMTENMPPRTRIYSVSASMPRERMHSMPERKSVSAPRERMRSMPGRPSVRYDEDSSSRTRGGSIYEGYDGAPRPYPPTQPMGFYTQISGSDSEDENDNNDISLASFDVGSGALAEDSKLKSSRQKANLEAKLGETEEVIGRQTSPDLLVHAGDGKMTYNATTSYYIREDGSDSSADISIRFEYLTSLPVSRRRDRSIFRWIHLKQEAMDFDIFSRCAREMPGLPEDQIQVVSHFLQRVREELERAIRSQHGTMGHFMKSGVITKRSQKDTSDGEVDRTYVFCCMPYHQLAPYSPLGETANPRLHPVRTLLQSKYPSTTKKRDFEQAVRSLSGTPSNHVFHTSNFWCLIINNKFMITSANGLSAHEISGDRMKFVPNIPTQPSNAASLMQSIQVFINDRLYALPLSQCDSWFKFTQNFSQYTVTLHEQYTIKWKGAIITPELWPLIIQKAQKEIIFISFSPRRRVITHGLEEEAVDEDLEDTLSRPHTPNDDRLSVISEVDSIRSGFSGKAAERERDNFSPTSSPGHSRKQSKDFLQSPIPTSGKSSPRTARSGSPTPGVISLREFHVLIWIAIRLGRTKPPENKESDHNVTNPVVKIAETEPRSDRELVNAYLNSVHSWLENQKNKKASALYRKGSQKSLDDVERAMQGMLKSRLDSPVIDAAKSSLIEAVKSIFSLFLPLEQRNTMCLKLWGALQVAITAAIPEEILRQFSETIQTLAQAAVIANTIKAQLSGGNAPPPKALSMPPDALRVWHQLLLCLFFWSPKSIGLSQSYANKCVELLRKAHWDLMKNPEAKKLEKIEAVLPNGLLAVIMDHIISDFTGTQPGLVDSYWEYFDELELKVCKDPRNRHNPAKTSSFISEVKIVLDSLERQQVVVDEFYLEQFFTRVGARHSTSTNSIQPRNPTHLLLQDALDGLRGKITSVQELLEKAEKLLELNADAIRHNKDKQDAAIYIFTIVTIIFLPISTVASVMGMNTADVRNMDKTQWVFWATALPLTVVVIVVSLFAAGILMQPFGRGADLPLTGNTERTRKRRNRRRKRGFVGERSLSSSSDSLVDEVD